MSQLSPIWTKKRIPQEELDAYLNGNPTSTTGPQHFLYQPNYDDCLGANDKTSSHWITHARNKKSKKFGVALKNQSNKFKNNCSKSMDVNSKIPISDGLPLGPDIRYREYKSYKPYKPNPDFTTDPFKQNTTFGKRNSNGFLSGAYREYRRNKKNDVVVKQRTITKPQKTKPILNKQTQDKKAQKPQKTKPNADKKVSEKTVAKPETKPKGDKQNLQVMSKPEKKTMFTETVDDDYDEFVSRHYLSVPKAARLTAAAQAWRRMYEQHPAGARESIRRSMRWNGAMDF